MFIRRYYKLKRANYPQITWKKELGYPQITQITQIIRAIASDTVSPDLIRGPFFNLKILKRARWIPDQVRNDIFL